MIYLDNAATSLKKPDRVIEAVAEAMTSLGNAGRGASEASLGALRAGYETRQRLADLFAISNPSRIAFTYNATESLNIAIKGILEPGDHVITTVLEHNSVLRPLYEMREQGVDLTIVGCDQFGVLNYEELESKIGGKTKVIICTHGSNLTGNIVDIQKIGTIARAHEVLFVVDASQTAGVLQIDVESMNIDVLCFTGHKGLLGPQGTGGIYVREGIMVRPLKVGGSGVDSYNQKHPVDMPSALEAGTLNTHGIAGLGAALSYIEEIGLDTLRMQEQMLMWQFYRGVIDIEGITVYGDFNEELENQRCAIVSLNIGAYDSAEVSDELFTTYHIATRAGAHCAPLMHEALGTKEQGAVRFSFSHMNTIEEVEIAIAAVKMLAQEE